MTPRIRRPGTPGRRSTVLTFDTGGLIGLESGSLRVQALLDRLATSGQRIAVPAGALARAWRGTPRQERLKRLLDSDQVDVVPLDNAAARAAGVLCRVTSTTDVIDASVILCARERGHRTVVTANGDRLRALDQTLAFLRP